MNEFQNKKLIFVLILTADKLLNIMKIYQTEELIPTREWLINRGIWKPVD
jgi:hypothetical protein